MECERSLHRLADRTTKGALGEALVRRYFEAAGWAVSSSGIQAVVDHVGEGNAKGDLAHLPDLVVSKLAGAATNPKTQPLGQAFYTEVKTLARWPAEPERKNFGRYHRWGRVLLVWVSPYGLQATWVADGNNAVVEEADFRPIATVGIVSVRHCDDPDCQHELRQHYDAAAATLACLPV